MYMLSILIPIFVMIFSSILILERTDKNLYIYMPEIIAAVLSIVLLIVILDEYATSFNVPLFIGLYIFIFGVIILFCCFIVHRYKKNSIVKKEEIGED